MSTAVDIDYLSRHHSSQAEGIAAAAPGQSPEHYRREIAKLAKVDEQLAALRSSLSDLNRKADDATNKHAETCGPLQLELENEATTAARRIALRVLVNEANAVLESALEPLKKSIAAAKGEIEFYRGKSGIRQSLENSFVQAGPREQQERIVVIRKVIEALQPAIFHWKSKAEAEAISLANEKARVERTGQSKFSPPGMDEAERIARIFANVAATLSGLEVQFHNELSEIRRARLAELYAG